MKAALVSVVKLLKNKFEYLYFIHNIIVYNGGRFFILWCCLCLFDFLRLILYKYV